jgi:hypothetical protein
MGRSNLDPGLLRRLADEGLSPAQQYLLSRLIRSIDTKSRADESVATFKALAIDVWRAEALLRSHGDTSQPRPRLLRSICDSAIGTIDRVIPHRQTDVKLQAMRAALYNVQSQLPITPDKATPASRTAARNTSTQLRTMLTDIDGIVSSMWSVAWSASLQSGAKIPFLDEVVQQVAGCMAVAGRDARFLVEDLRNVVRRGVSAATILTQLMPSRTAYRVACVVDGVSSLRALSSFAPGATTVSLRGDPPTDWGGSTKRLTKFFSSVQPERRACLVLLQTYASDKGAAAMQGRRIVEEALDQYVMSGRLLDTRLGDRVLVGSLTNTSTAEVSSRGPGTGRAYPLTVVSPDGLREAMRMAHLARTTESPTTRAALAWVALESCNIPPAKIDNLAAALALQAFRNAIVNSFEDLRDAIKAERRHRTQRVATCESALSRYRRSRDQAVASGRDKLDAKIAFAQSAADVARADLDQFDRNAGSTLATMETYLGPRTNDDSYLRDPNNWVTLLSPSLPGDSSATAAARIGLEEMSKRFTWPALACLKLWRARCSQPAKCADAVDELASRFKTGLTSLYAIRNLAFHGGVFSHHGDVLLGYTGIAIVDLAMEFIGNWYTVETRTMAPGSNASTPIQVVDALAQRATKLSTDLRRATTLERLNLTHLTSPTSNGWDRA